MFGRGHIDHFGLDVADAKIFEELRRRLVEAGATDGTVTDFGITRNVWFEDPDGMGCETSGSHHGSAVRKGVVEDLIEALTGGHVTAVKIVLTSVLLALAVYQALLMAVGYGKLRLPFLASGPASVAHRAVGDAIVVLVLVVGAFCLGTTASKTASVTARPAPRVEPRCTS